MTKNHTYALTKRRKKSPIFIEPSFPSPACLADDSDDLAEIRFFCVVVSASIAYVFPELLVPDVATYIHVCQVISVILFDDGIQAATNQAVDYRTKEHSFTRLKDDQMINLPDRAVHVIVDHEHTVVNDLVRLLLEGAEDSGFLFVRHDGFLSGSHTQTAYGT